MKVCRRFWLAIDFKDFTDDLPILDPANEKESLN